MSDDAFASILVHKNSQKVLFRLCQWYFQFVVDTCIARERILVQDFAGLLLGNAVCVLNIVRSYFDFSSAELLTDVLNRALYYRRGRERRNPFYEYRGGIGRLGLNHVQSLAGFSWYPSG